MSSPPELLTDAQYIQAMADAVGDWVAPEIKAHKARMLKIAAALAAAPSNGAAQESGAQSPESIKAATLVAAPPSADEVKRLADDARRYRWLRDESEWEPFDSSWLVKIDIYGQGASDMDAAIDALCNPGEALREGGQ